MLSNDTFCKYDVIMGDEELAVETFSRFKVQNSCHGNNIKLRYLQIQSIYVL